MEQLLPQKEFFKKYNINAKAFEKTALTWADLESIYQDYLQVIPKLEASAIYLFNSLMKTSQVHSVRYRIKDAEHVVEKIIRRRIKEPSLTFTIDNYKTELTDLIGLRALHLFKEEWHAIHELITSTWDLKQKPVANYREGDSSEYKKKFEELGCDIKEHRFGYRSVHYIVETKPTKQSYFAEIQVRTIFEEAWSEIDHTIRYPYDQDNPVFGQFLLILNRLAGSADEMGTFIKFLKKELQFKEDKHKEAIVEKDNLIKQLEQKVKDLKLKEPDYKFLTDGLEKLKLPVFNASDYKIRDLDFLNKIQPIDLLEAAKFSLPDSYISKTLEQFKVPKVEVSNIDTPPKKKQ